MAVVRRMSAVKRSEGRRVNADNGMSAGGSDWKGEVDGAWLVCCCVQTGKLPATVSFASVSSDEVRSW